MGIDSINSDIESLTTTDGNQTATPEWSPHGVPMCQETCRLYDGKRCELTGFRPSAICEPSVIAMRELLVNRTT